MYLQWFGKIFFIEYQKEKLCMIMFISEDLKVYFEVFVNKF